MPRPLLQLLFQSAMSGLGRAIDAALQEQQRQQPRRDQAANDDRCDWTARLATLTTKARPPVESIASAIRLNTRDGALEIAEAAFPAWVPDVAGTPLRADMLRHSLKDS